MICLHKLPIWSTSTAVGNPERGKWSSMRLHCMHTWCKRSESEESYHGYTRRVLFWWWRVLLYVSVQAYCFSPLPWRRGLRSELTHLRQPAAVLAEVLLSPSASPLPLPILAASEWIWLMSNGRSCYWKDAAIWLVPQRNIRWTIILYDYVLILLYWAI
jgi:hypothetical protein